jgi:PhnB protein
MYCALIVVWPSRRQRRQPFLGRNAAMQHLMVAPVKGRSGAGALHCPAIGASIAPPRAERRCIMPSVKPIPDGYRSVTPYMIVGDGAGAVGFYQRVFGARLRLKLERPDGKLGHTELEIGDSVIMLADEYPDHQARAPGHFGGSPVTLHLYVEDVDAVVARAVAAGAKLARPVENMFYGDRAGSFTDPFGHVWHVATHIEDVPPDEINRRAAAAMQSQGKGQGE